MLLLISEYFADLNGYSEIWGDSKSALNRVCGSGNWFLDLNVESEAQARKLWEIW